MEDWTPWTYLLTQTTVIAHYIGLSILGGPLALDYDGWPMSRSAVEVLPYALPLLALFAVTVIGVIRKRAWAFPAVVWFAALAPSSSILPLATEIAAERRMYIPLAAFLALVVCGAYAIGTRLLARRGAGDPADKEKTTAAPGRLLLGRVAALVALFGVGITYGSMTYARNQDFESTERIWQDTVEKRPRNSRARLNYGVSLADLRAHGRGRRTAQRGSPAQGHERRGAPESGRAAGRARPRR